jgi:lysophospholipase L1-like esterase
LAIFFPTALAACGGGGDTQVQPPTCTPRVVRVQVFGDSVNRAHAPYLQAELDRRFGAGAVLVDNRAVGGTTSEQLVTGTDGLNAPWPGSVVADVVLVNHGINDAYAPLGVTIERYRANLRTLASAPAAVILQTPSPTTAAVYDSAPRAAAMREVAAETGAQLADVQAYVLGLPGWTVYLPDGIHPDANLHGLIARDVTAHALQQAVERLRLAACR